MHRIAALLFALVAASAGVHALPDSRILDGTPATWGQIPWQVSLRGHLNNMHLCGGAIINQRWVVTAGHCVYEYLPIINVVAGALRPDSEGDYYAVARAIRHPAYGGFETLHNDIAVIQVERDFIYRTNAQPVKLPTSRFTEVGAPASVAGWGSTELNGEESQVLLFINTFTTSQADCEASSWHVTENNICTLTRVGQGNCDGDSGSPLTVDGVLIGVVSWGDACGLGVADYYTRVFSYLEWITSYTG